MLFCARRFSLGLGRVGRGSLFFDPIERDAMNQEEIKQRVWKYRERAAQANSEPEGAVAVVPYSPQLMANDPEQCERVIREDAAAHFLKFRNAIDAAAIAKPEASVKILLTVASESGQYGIAACGRIAEEYGCPGVAEAIAAMLAGEWIKPLAAVQLCSRLGVDPNSVAGLAGNVPKRRAKSKRANREE